VPRQPSANLFPTDRPLPADLLIGRGEDVHEIATTLAGGGHLIISGPRRTGKTTVCDAAMRALEGEGCYVVEVDLFRIASAAELAEVLVARTIANRSTLRRIVHQAREAGRLVADAAGVSAVVKSKTELGEELEIAFTPQMARRDPERYLDYALALPGRIAEADGKRVVVFFDEFQEIAGSRAPYGDPDALTKRMRAIFQRNSEVSLLFAGSIEHLMRDLFTPRQRAFSQFGSFHELRPIALEDWAEGLRGRFDLDGCKIDERGLQRLVDLGAGHPRATMLIAQKTHMTSVLLETREIDLAAVEQGYRAAIEGERVNHEQSVERLRGTHPYALQVARRIAQDERPYQDLPRNSVRRALEELRGIGIARSEGRGEWKITDPLLARYLAELDPML
jgi:DNA polymerase III delta prime subunit